MSPAMAATMGVLGCLTTAAWGSVSFPWYQNFLVLIAFAQLSDRVGRMNIQGLALVGILSTDLVFLLVYNCFERLPGGYWFLIVGSIIEGILGGETFAAVPSLSIELNNRSLDGQCKRSCLFS